MHQVGSGYDFFGDAYKHLGSITGYEAVK